MIEVRVSNIALNDIAQILDHLTGAAGPQVAQQYASEFEACIARLADFPGIGSPRPMFGRAARLSVVSPYLIFHEGGPEADVVVVLRVLDGRRKITATMIDTGRDE